MMSELRSLAGKAGPGTAQELSELEPEELDRYAPVVRRHNGGAIATQAVLELFAEMPTFELPSIADSWLAPRLHSTLRLTRREASDRGIWRFLAGGPLSEHVAWRWKPSRQGKDAIPDERWNGGINKQTFARLWWGAELFRNGDDYGPVEHFFERQDFPNSLLHVHFVRIRPVALGILAAIREATGDTPPSSQQIQDVARRVNLTIAARSMEAATALYHPNAGVLHEWISEAPVSWVGADPIGPADGRVPAEILAIGKQVGTEICELAGISD